MRQSEQCVTLLARWAAAICCFTGLVISDDVSAAESADERGEGRYCVKLGKPTEDWLEGLPLANGITAAMVYGTPSKTVLSLNHVDFWRDNLRPEIGKFANVVRESQRLMLQGKTKEANDCYYQGIQQNVMPRQRGPYHGFAGYTNSFQPVGDLVIAIDDLPEFADYQRALDLRDGIARGACKSRGAVISQEYFVSAKCDLLVVSLAAEKPITGSVSFARVPQAEYQWTAVAQEARLLVAGRFDEGVASAVLLTAEAKNGENRVAVTPDAAILRFRDVTELQLRIAVEAGKREFDAEAACARKTQTAAERSLDDIRSEHRQEHRAMFDRADVALGPTPHSPTPNADVLIERAVAGDFDNRLAELVFQMGRYLMMSCNRAQRRPANLQGIWNNQIEPMWDADWHLDMNVEMNHWLANPTNLDECNTALFRQMEQFVEQGRKTAENIAGCSGILFYTIAGGDGMTWTQQGGAWTGAAGWIAQHFWTHYEFTQDREFLANHAYPFLKQVGLFYRDFLVKNNCGNYVTALSHSPENTPPNGHVNNVHCTMDTAIVRELMRHLLEAGKILGVDQELWPVWQDLHDNVLPYPVSESGVLKEWPAPLEEQPQHRHYSHLYPLFPGDEFTPEATPALFAAARGAVDLREAQGRSANFGWSYPYLACFHARLGEGEKALDSLHCMARSVTADNLLTCATEWRGQGLTGVWEFNVPRLFQIEAGLGASAGMAEMLLQSHQGCIRLLPALPAKWKTGQFRGLKARGAFVVDAAWEDGVVREATVESLKGAVCNVRNCTPWKSVTVSSGQSVEFTVDAQSKVIRFATQAGCRYSIRFE